VTGQGYKPAGVSVKWKCPHCSSPSCDQDARNYKGIIPMESIALTDRVIGAAFQSRAFPCVPGIVGDLKIF
jgi:hypothetical protein